MVISPVFFLNLLTPNHDITFQMNDILIHQNKHLSFLSFKLVCLYIIRTLSRYHHGPCPCCHIPKIGMSSTMPNMFVSLYNSSSVSSKTYLHLVLHQREPYVPVPTKGQEKVVKYNDCSPSFNLWFPSLHQWVIGN